MNLKSFFAITFASFASIGSAQADGNSAYIVNGINADVDQYPSFVSLYVDPTGYLSDDKYFPYCGGVLIDPEHILTAAHCIYGDDLTQLYTSVVFKPQHEIHHHPQHHGFSRRVSDIYYRKDYVDSVRQGLPNDIAILKLEAPRQVGEIVGWDRYETYRQDLNNLFVAIGHGNTSQDEKNTNYLQKVNLNLVTNDTCRLQYGDKILDSHICFTGYYNQYSGLLNSTCNGDSGGPVYGRRNGRNVLIGITSFGPKKCGDPNYPITSVFTEVADYADWITDILNNQIDPDITVHLRTEEKNRLEGVVEVVSKETQSVEPQKGKSSGGSLNLIWLALLGSTAARRRATIN
ncbi:secreted trypsin-like serine protease [Vibrio ishigakensis]|uniref:Secreted trypsin-like serine protease n=1 Tax=Vibrio ishigakensis TaxID=1481914 RepID=A0A0B8NYE1_9VIBR|nr:trypsin-like serine protease [Vibrio ishigakensis]GAM57332.1 secreted trypsin-like serine protease [Vibrio ishigakensis]